MRWKERVITVHDVDDDDEDNAEQNIFIILKTILFYCGLFSIAEEQHLTWMDGWMEVWVLSFFV